MHSREQRTGYALVYWKDTERPFLEIEAPFNTHEDLNTVTFVCFETEYDFLQFEFYKRVLVPLDAISYIEFNLG